MNAALQEGIRVRCSETGTPLDLGCRSAEGIVIVSAMGELDASNADVLRTTLVREIDGHPQADGGVLVLDLSGVCFIDSIGVGTLVAAMKHGLERGVHLRFVVAHPQLLRVLQITGVSRVLDLYENLNDAIFGHSS